MVISSHNVCIYMVTLRYVWLHLVIGGYVWLWMQGDTQEGMQLNY